MKLIGTPTGDNMSIHYADSSDYTVNVNSISFSASTSLAAITLDGGAGNDTIDASAISAPVTLDGGAGANLLEGGSGNDWLDGGLDQLNTVHGNGGNDTVNYSNYVGSPGTSAGVSIGPVGGAEWATDRVSPTHSVELYSVEIINGTPDSDWIDMPGLTINGAAGNDSIYGNASLDGGAGDDVIGYDGTGPMLAAGDVGNDSITGGPLDDTIYGGDGNNTLVGAAGDDVLTGGTGTNVINGGDGNDSIVGGAGNNTIHGDGDNDTIFGESGNNTLYGDDGDDFVFAAGGTNTMYGGDGNDTISGGFAPPPYGVEATAPLISGGAGDDVISGGLGGSTVDGDDGDDLIYAAVGNAHVNGDAGNDTIYGSDGVVVIITLLQGTFGNPATGTGATLDGGAGNDLIDCGAVAPHDQRASCGVDHWWRWKRHHQRRRGQRHHGRRRGRRQPRWRHRRRYLRLCRHISAG